MTEEAEVEGAKTDEGTRELDRMRRLGDLNLSLWGGMRWTVGFLGASGPITFGLELSGDPDLLAFQALFGAAAAAFAGGVLYWLIKTVVASRSRHPDEAPKTRRSAYPLLGLLVVLQVAALMVVLGGQVLAVAVAFDDENVGESLEATLAEHVETYAGANKALTEIREHCRRHIDEDRASNGFVEVCIAFNASTPPAPADANGLLERLREVEAAR